MSDVDEGERWFRMPRHQGIPFDDDYSAPVGQLIPYAPDGRQSRWGQITASRVEDGDCWVTIEPADPLGEADH